MGNESGRHPVISNDPHIQGSILGWLDEQSVGRLEERPIWYGPNLLAASKAMLTPQIGCTEGRPEVATTDQTIQNETPFQKPRITK